MARPRRPPSPAGSASSMVLSRDLEPLSTRMIRLVSRSLIRKLPSLSGTTPHGASRSEAISRARGSPRDWTVLGVGLLGFGLLGLGLDGGIGLAEAATAVRVSGLGSLAALVHALTESRAPQAAASALEGKFLGAWRRSGACIARREGYRVVSRARRTP